MTLYSDKKESFAGVVDSNGKLLVGEFREIEKARKKELPLLFILNPLYFILVF